MKKVLFALATAASLGGAAQAAVINGTVTLDPNFNSTNPGFQVKANVLSDLGPQGFTSLDFSTTDLNVGDHFSFDMFVLRTLQTVFTPGDDEIRSPFGILFATDLGDLTVSGKTYAEKTGDDVYGVLDITSPASIYLGGKHLLIEVADAVFNKGVGGFSSGKNNGAVVTATVSVVAAIPVPAALPMGMGALGLMGFIARRRKAKAA